MRVFQQPANPLIVIYHGFPEGAKRLKDLRKDAGERFFAFGSE
jgi:hypothetical protein